MEGEGCGQTGSPHSAGRVPELGAGGAGGSVIVCFTLLCILTAFVDQKDFDLNT